MLSLKGPWFVPLPVDGCWRGRAQCHLSGWFRGRRCGTEPWEVVEGGWGGGGREVDVLLEMCD